ncbi:hypothetical protein [Ornithinimicrobium cavernae]|uniref:hypothetical protein n=1 Tax=Ornithinimicrobium cavernae TaxID=2666047 RepID=UPI000D68883D|nr:hypothetical protein [Ornithinimicrobium cavernae]
MRSVPNRSATGRSLPLALGALRAWSARQVLVAAGAALVVAVVIGLATVLIPNPVFGRDIPPVWWNYPVWLVTSALSGMLLATYVRPSGTASDGVRPPDPEAGHADRRSGRFGVTGGVLAWFAVGCPVCNKLALLALGYSGAITWFAPLQPFLAVAALALTAAALVWRLRGQVYCPVTAPAPAVVA